jgi:glycosyltransferase involved in cell wall biosynthesis
MDRIGMTGTPLRIAHVLPWPTVGGVEHGTLRLIAGLDKDRFGSIAFCAGGGTEVADLFESHGVPTAGYLPVEPSLTRPGFASATRALAREFRQRGIDIVHCADLLGAFHAGPAARLAGCGLLCHVRCAYPELTWRQRLFLRPVQRWLFVSHATRAAFAMPTPDARSTVLHDAVDVPRAPRDSTEARAVLKAFGVPERARIIGMVARVAPIKDFQTLALAIRSVVSVEPSIHVVVVGDTSGTASYRTHFAAVQRMLQDLGVSDHFTFTGFRPDVQLLMSTFEIVTLVTHSEGLPLVLLEAMAMGKPVVATAVGGIPEIVRPGETGLLHERGNAAELAAAYGALLAEPELAARLATAAEHMVRGQFSTARFSAALESVYESTAEARTGVRRTGTFAAAVSRRSGATS